MGKHTPGPHKVVEADHLGDPAFAIRAADGDLVAVGMIKADAVLFAAAPELFAAALTVLEGLNARIDAADPTAVPVFDGIAALHDAIAKAGA